MNSHSNPKLSVVTAVFNRAGTIEECVRSVVSQSAFEDGAIEYVVIDGGSTDGTDRRLDPFRSSIATMIREPDDGIYDALNKGIRVSKSDIVGFLHADDLLANKFALERILECFEKSELDAVYGDLVYVDAENPDRIIRYWKAGPFNRKKFRWGWMPPHPTVYIRKSVYERLGAYRTDLGSAADYECLVRLMYKGLIRVGYIPEILVRMRVGGKSNASFRNRLSANQADRQAWIENGLQPPIGLRVTKPMRKLIQYVARPPLSK